LAASWQLQEAWGKRFEATQPSRCAVAAGECSSQQFLQLQSLPISEQQQRCSITVMDPTAGLLLPSQEHFLSPSGQPHSSALLITGSAVSSSTRSLCD